jgi:hypothetical protein
MSYGGNLFGTKRTWMGIVGISVIFTMWSSISSCNAKNAAKEEGQRIDRLATGSSAAEYCKETLRKRESSRQRFEITSTSSTRMSEHGYRVQLTYVYWNGATRRMAQDTETCNLEYRASGWRAGIRF